jgi:putative ABC transport system permease protein
VVFQFATAIILIVGTIVIYSQLNYIRSKNLGYNRDQVLVLQNTGSLSVHAKSFKNEVQQIPGVEAGSMTNNLPTDNSWSTNIYSKDAAQSAGQVTGLGQWEIDADFIPTMGMRMAKGRNFSPQLPTDSNAILMNETAASLLGFTDPLSHVLYFKGGPHNIIGVVKDFNAGSLRNKIAPIIFHLSESRNNMAFRIQAKNIPAIIAQIENKYHGVDQMAGSPFMYSFMDADFNRLYNAEQRTGKIFIYFAFFAVMIACLGLFGLVTYAAEQRTREIGIRKVLGASVAGIVALLSKDFLKLVLISLVIASPVAWLLMNKWLQNFAYRIDINWWVFAVAAFLAIVITVITVSFRAIAAALANPVDCLLSE